MDQEKFNEEITKKVSYIETVIKNYLPEETGYQKTVLEAMNYSILAGGKRLRPMLLLETYCLFGGKDINRIQPFMAAMEMIHTYSLVHDDLPAMDNDEFRRGRKTTHIVYGEAMGILAGDGLLNYALETACKAFEMTPSSEAVPMEEITWLKRAAKAMEILSAKSGIYGMLGGQVVDVEGKMTSLDVLLYMYQLKTGALIQSSMMIGAVLAGATAEELRTVEQMATDIGVAFQIQDDILDETSTLEVLGKPIHSDERNDKVTFITFTDLENAKNQVRRYSNSALDGFRLLGRENEFMKELIINLITRKK
jgi:geranylgeranyl diphosphate synthase type II